MVNFSDFNSQLDDAYKQNYALFEGLENRTRLQKSAGFSANAGRSQQGSVLESDTDLPIPPNKIRSFIRNAYGKHGQISEKIGDHPDFEYLKETTNTTNCAITTLFMDIEGSTKLSLFYDLETVRKIKNAIIQTAIDIVVSFDGHVHRIMGDAVMAYFGGAQKDPYQSIIDAINCGSLLQYFSSSYIVPNLKLDSEFGIRIGVDHGKQEDVLWSAYGYPGIGEVTATSFFVDIASKLQQAASRNSVMVGQSLKEYIDFPEKLLSTKTIRRNREQIDLPYVEPNYSDREGNPINYKQFRLDSETYLHCSPIAHMESPDPRISPVEIEAQIGDGDSVENFSHDGNLYLSSSTVLEKERALLFIPKFEYPGPYTINFTVENHGAEASEVDDNGNHDTELKISSLEQHQQLRHLEQTSYRGLHYLNVGVRANSGDTRAVRYGVYIK